MKLTWIRVGVFFLLLGLLACPKPSSKEALATAEANPLEEALLGMSKEELLSHIRVLSSDEFEGRAPATKGEELTVGYLQKQFKALGLKPGNPDGTFVQKVPLVGSITESNAKVMFGKNTWELEIPKDGIVNTGRVTEAIEVKDSEIVFVGYGIVAPEYGWDDFKDVDVRGKTVLMLVNDPPIPDPNAPDKLDENFFKGKAMTYYGRWSYKYEIAAKKGAAAAIVLHETKPAGYPFSVISGGWGREGFGIKSTANTEEPVAVRGWISVETSKKLFSLGGQDYETLKKAALRKEFRPVSLKGTASFSIKKNLRDVNSQNVIAKLEGSDPSLKDQYIVYTAHWDHMGKDTKLSGDQIFNGARDNASGTAAILLIAKAFSQIKIRPKRSILFAAVAAEEKGLLGSKYFVQNPLYPLTSIVANFNIDGLNTWGRTKDFIVVGLGLSSLDDIVLTVAAAQGRVVKPDAEPEKGFYYRSDHFSFAKEGIPALDTDGGTEYIGKPEGYGKEKRDEYTKNDYHQVSDEIKPSWDLSGAIEDLQLLFQVGYEVAQDDKIPEWKEGTEFKAKRDQMMNF